MPPIDPLTAGLQAGGNVLSTGINAWLTAAQNKRNRQHDFDMSDYAYGKDLDMWNKQNEYNTPTKQMQRFKDAGLNPHLIYGKGTPGNATQLPKYNKSRYVGTAPQISMPDMLGMYMSLKKTNAEIDNVRALASNVKMRTIGEEIKNAIITGDKELLPDKLDYQRAKYESDTQRLPLEIEKLRQGNKLSKYKGKWAKEKYQQWDKNKINIDSMDPMMKKLYMIWNTTEKATQDFIQFPENYIEAPSGMYPKH